MKPCITPGCSGMAIPSSNGGAKCGRCSRRYEKVRNKKKNSRIERKLYLDPVYRSMVPSGPCYYCGKPADTREHLKPISKNGTNDRLNIVFACRSCNSSKGNEGE